MTDILFKVCPLASPPKNWNQQEQAWLQIARGVVSEGTFDPLTIKALYITGLVYDLCSAVNILLAPNNPTPTTFFPAYTVFSSMVELLGRCLAGNSTDHGSGEDLTTGFKWIARASGEVYSAVSEDQVLITTRNFPYTIKELVRLRHFAAHGQAVIKIEDFDFDPLVLGEFPPTLANAMEAYLTQLTSNETLASYLAKASIRPFHSQPIMKLVWELTFTKEWLPTMDARAIRKMDWSYKSPLDSFIKSIGAA